MITAMVTCVDNNGVEPRPHVFYIGNPFFPGPNDNSEDNFRVGDIVYLDEHEHIWKKQRKIILKDKRSTK